MIPNSPSIIMFIQSLPFFLGVPCADDHYRMLLFGCLIHCMTMVALSEQCLST